MGKRVINLYKIKKEHVEIHMFDRHYKYTGFTKIDKEKFKELATYSWRLDSVGYASTMVKGIPIRMHKILIKAEAGLITDHINRNKLDNRTKNLRIITRQENNFNRIGNGIRKTPQGKWNARIRWNGKEKHIGNYDTKKEAREAYLREKDKYLKMIDIDKAL